MKMRCKERTLMKVTHGATVYAIVNDRLSTLELAITPDRVMMGGPVTSR